MSNENWHRMCIWYCIVSYCIPFSLLYDVRACICDPESAIIRVSVSAFVFVFVFIFVFKVNKLWTTILSLGKYIYEH